MAENPFAQIRSMRAASSFPTYRTPSASSQDEPGMFGALSGGFQQTLGALRNTLNLYAGDDEDVLAQALRSSQIERTPAQEAFLEQIRMRSEEADEGVIDGLRNVALAAWNEPKGAFHELIAQMPNSAVALGGMAAGAKTGAAIGAMTGGPVGATIGTIAGGVLGMFAGNTALETGFLAGEAASDQALTPEERANAMRQGAVKGGVITAVDTATLGLSRALAGAPGRAVERAVTDTLARHGVDVTSDAAIKAAVKQNPVLLKIASDAGAEALSKTMQRANRLGREGVRFSLESVGEGAGEFLGSAAAGLEVSPTDAVMEALMSIPQSGAEMVLASSTTQPGRATRAAFGNDVTIASRIMAAPDIDEAIRQAAAALEATPIPMGQSSLAEEFDTSKIPILDFSPPGADSAPIQPGDFSPRMTQLPASLDAFERRESDAQSQVDQDFDAARQQKADQDVASAMADTERLDSVIPEADEMAQEFARIEQERIEQEEVEQKYTREQQPINPAMQKALDRARLNLERSEAPVAREVERQRSAEGKAAPAPRRVEAPAERVEFKPTSLDVVNVPVNQLSLSKDVPNFKRGAQADTGVVEPLEGEFQLLGANPILVWERKDGRLEVISGRHRLDLAKRSGLAEMPAQVVKESEGFTRRDAMIADAELNIRDNQGEVTDYAAYFKTTGISPEEAEQRGLLSRAKGRAGFAIAGRGSDLLFRYHQSGDISDSQAEAIANAAPGNEALQALGIDRLQKGATIENTVGMIEAVRAMAPKAEGSEDLDLFGFDESALKEAEQIGKEAARRKKEIRSKISAAKGAAARPDKAGEMGVDVRDPKKTKQQLRELEELARRWDNWPTDPELRRELVGDAAQDEFALEQPTEQSLRQQEARKAEAEKKRQQAEQKALVDAQAGELVLAGSDSEIDQAEARGQQNLEDQAKVADKTTMLRAIERLRKVRPEFDDKSDEARAKHQGDIDFAIEHLKNAIAGKEQAPSSAEIDKIVSGMERRAKTLPSKERIAEMEENSRKFAEERDRELNESGNYTKPFTSLEDIPGVVENDKDQAKIDRLTRAGIDWTPAVGKAEELRQKYMERGVRDSQESHKARDLPSMGEISGAIARFITSADALLRGDKRTKEASAYAVIHKYGEELGINHEIFTSENLEALRAKVANAEAVAKDAQEGSPEEAVNTLAVDLNDLEVALESVTEGIDPRTGKPISSDGFRDELLAEISRLRDSVESALQQAGDLVDDDTASRAADVIRETDKYMSDGEYAEPFTEEEQAAAIEMLSIGTVLRSNVMAPSVTGKVEKINSPTTDGPRSDPRYQVVIRWMDDGKPRRNKGNGALSYISEFFVRDGRLLSEDGSGGYDEWEILSDPATAAEEIELDTSPLPKGARSAAHDYAKTSDLRQRLIGEMEEVLARLPESIDREGFRSGVFGALLDDITPATYFGEGRNAEAKAEAYRAGWRWGDKRWREMLAGMQQSPEQSEPANEVAPGIERNFIFAEGGQPFRTMKEALQHPRMDGWDAPNINMRPVAEVIPVEGGFAIDPYYHLPHRRAKPGGEYGANGMWYEGGKFIATSEETIKQDGAGASNPIISFGKYAGKDIRDVIRDDPGYAEWMARELQGSKRGEPFEEWLAPLRKTPQQKQAELEANAREDVDAEEILRILGLEIDQAGDDQWLVKGDTYIVRQQMNKLGGKWNDARKGYVFNYNPGQVIATEFADEEGTGVDIDKLDPKGRNQRARARAMRPELDAAPDQKPEPKTLRDNVNAATKKLVARGLNFGMTEEVVREQTEDIGQIKWAYQNDKPMFMLASEAGSGKTFVLGGAIREISQIDPKAKFVYVTMNQNLITQIKKDLKDYDIEGKVEFFTYSDLSGNTKASQNLSTDENTVLVFDEAHNVKNIDSAARAQQAQGLMAGARMTVFASATPYENPVEMKYIEATGVFEAAEDHDNFAIAFGASVQPVKVNEGRKTVTKFKPVWKGGRSSKRDAAAARRWVEKQGIFTQRRKKLPKGMVDSSFRPVKASEKWTEIYERVTAAYDSAINIEPSVVLMMHKMNAQKRILEAAKIEAGIKAAEKAVKEGKQAVIFVETKSERELRNDPSFQQMMAEMNEWRMTGGYEMNGPPPYPRWRLALAQAFDEMGIDYTLPSVVDEIVRHFGRDKVGVYVGAKKFETINVTDKSAVADKDAWLANEKPILVATMAKGGTGLSLHPTKPGNPRVQIGINLPWKATGVDQVSGRLARYGMQSHVDIDWLFASNIPVEATIARRVGDRMASMGATVSGIEINAAETLQDWDFEGVQDVTGANVLNSVNESRRNFIIGTAAAVAGAAVSGHTVFADIKLGKAQPISADVLKATMDDEIVALIPEMDAHHLNGAKIIKSMLAKIAEAGPKELRSLALKIHQLMPDEGVLFGVDTMSRLNVSGAVEMFPDYAVMTLFTAGESTGLSYATFMHEALHAAVAARYYSLSRGLAMDNYSKIGMSKPKAEAAMMQFRELWNEFRKLAQDQDLGPLARDGSNREAVWLKEAANNPDEFFVRALTDPNLQNYLASKEYKGKTLWERFKDWVKYTLLGFSREGTKASWLDAALIGAQELMEAMGQDPADFSISLAYENFSSQRQRNFSRNDIDELVQIWKALARDDAVFQLPISNKKTMPEIVAELEPDFTLQPAGVLGRGADEAWVIVLPEVNAAATVFREGNEVYIDVSGFLPGEDGKRIYNIAANYAYNIGAVFKGDPLGLTNEGMTRRLENMISSALKFRTTRHLKPHSRQLAGASFVPSIEWREGQHDHNIREMLVASYEANLRQFPEIANLRYDPDTDQIVDARTGEAWTDERIEEAARQARADEKAANAGTGEEGAGVPGRPGVSGPITAGRTTFKRAVLTNTVLRGTSEERSKILARFGGIGSESLASTLYSRNQGAQVGDLDDELARKLGLGSKADSLSSKIEALKNGNWRQAIRGLADRAHEGVFDGLIGLRRAEEAEGVGIGIGDYEGSGYVGARLASGIADQMHALLHYGAMRWQDGVAVEVPDTKGLLTVLGDLGEDLNNWLAWMAGNRGLELKQQGREENLTESDIQALIDLARGKEEKFEAAKDAYSVLNKAMLDFAEGAGLINPESRAQWESEWYVPFYRLSDLDGDAALLGPKTKRGLSHQAAGIKRLVGKDVPTNDLLENILTNWLKLLDASMKNSALLKTVDNFRGTEYMTDESTRWQKVVVSKSEIAKRIKSDRKLMGAVADFLGMPGASLVQVANELAKIDSKGFEEMWAPVAPRDPDVIRVKRGGKNEYYRVHDASMLRSITYMATSSFNDPVTKAARWFKRVLTTGVTASPDFMIRNFVRDAAHAYAINPDGFRFARDSIKGLKGALKEDEGYRELMFAGASFQGGYVHGLDPEASAQIIRRALQKKGLSGRQIDAHMGSLLDTPQKLYGALEGAWQTYRTLGDKIENSNRLATYNNARANGKSLAQAVFEAKDLMDYSLRGNMQAMIWLTDVVPFLNARLQGLSKLARAGKANPHEVGLAVGKIALFSVALAMLNDDDEDYQQLPDWEKDAYWHIFIDGAHWRIPKPFEIGILAGAIPERMYHTWVRDNQPDEKLLWTLKHGIYETLGFNPLPQALIPVVEAWANRSFYFDTPIEGMSDELRLPEDRYDAYTSNTMINLGRLLGVSPKKLQHLWEGYTGTMGAYALEVADMMTRAAEGSGIPRPSVAVGDLPVISSFYKGSDPKRATQYTTEFYDRLNEVTQIYNSMRDRMKTDPEVGRSMMAENQDKLRYRKFLDTRGRLLTDLRNNRERVLNSRELTSQQKREQVDRINARINELTKQAANMTEGAF